MLVSEKLSYDDVRISSDHLKIFSIEFVLKPVLALVLATLTDGGEVLPGTLVLARRAVPKQYHLKKCTTMLHECKTKFLNILTQMLNNVTRILNNITRILNNIT
jgi:hypothetical protein